MSRPKNSALSQPDAKQKHTEEENANPTKTRRIDGKTLATDLEEAKASAPVLVVISGRPLGKSFFITKEAMVLGRDLTADLSIPETSISRRHTEFSNTPKGIAVKDMGSTNGTYVNDVKLEANAISLLNDGDLIRCGNTILKFLKEGKIENIHYGKMYDLANTDGLTGAHNKKSIIEIINDEFRRAQSRSTPLSFLLFDIDHFKKTNDTFGHPAGDHVLKETCTLIKNKMIRQKDSLGRYGGEEFALVLPNTPLQIAVDVAERIRSTIEKYSYTFEEKQIPVTISIGVVALDSTTKSADDLINLADKALYDAKNQGRNRVCVR